MQTQNKSGVNAEQNEKVKQEKTGKAVQLGRFFLAGNRRNNSINGPLIPIKQFKADTKDSEKSITDF